jgi:hypothetical protein
LASADCEYAKSGKTSSVTKLDATRTVRVKRFGFFMLSGADGGPDGFEAAHDACN